jgi:hypothetical protein
MPQSQSSDLQQNRQGEVKASSAKRTYHTPAAPQEFGQLRTLTLGGVTYVPQDISFFSAAA